MLNIQITPIGMPFKHNSFVYAINFHITLYQPNVPIHGRSLWWRALDHSTRSLAQYWLGTIQYSATNFIRRRSSCFECRQVCIGMCNLDSEKWVDSLNPIPLSVATPLIDSDSVIGTGVPLSLSNINRFGLFHTCHKLKTYGAMIEFLMQR